MRIINVSSNSYRRDIERFLQWCFFKANKTVKQIKRAEFEAFLSFCQHPPASWIATSVEDRFIENNGETVPNKKWRPFVVKISKTETKSGNKPNKKNYELSEKGFRALFAIIGSFYNYLIQEEYTLINPSLLIRQKSKFYKKRKSSQTIRRLSELQWGYVIETAEMMAQSDVYWIISSNLTGKQNYMSRRVSKYISSLCTLLILPFFFLSNAWGSDGTWSKLNTTGTPPSVRSAPGLELIGSYIYLFGGVKDDFKAGNYPTYNDLYRLDLKTNAWEAITTKGKLPPPRAFNAITYAKNKDLIIIFGGNHYTHNLLSYKAYNDMWAYSLSKNTWVEIHPVNQGPSKRGAPMNWLMGNKWYIFGGISSWFQMLNDLWVYDIDANQWTQLIPNHAAGSPPARYMEVSRGSELITQGNLILHGGEVFSIFNVTDSILNDVWEYNLKTNKWTNITPAKKDNMPRGQNSASEGIIGNYLYVQGGDVEGEGVEGCGSPYNQNLGNELWRFDLIKHVWTKLKPNGIAIPSLKRTNGIIVNGKLYVFYGFDFQCKDDKGPGQVWNNNIYVYEPGH